ncbi:hypothetical protein F383_32252 [Gossypium arboreum]|uniref:Uncharacterized protein n=1 Tax=Gossypium arboreum TaxID=29729 RepID=A0A0B0N0C4_GOSAR|nr:hypothetical protein F383_32252 [Gossypium arboreum]
MPLMLYKCVRD